MFAASVSRESFKLLCRFSGGGAKGIKKFKATYVPISEYSTGSRNANYNLEENPSFAKKQQKAREQRDLIKQVEAQEITPRRKRRLYDRPKYDYDISA